MKRDAPFSAWVLASSAALAAALVIAASAAADTVTCAYYPGGGFLHLPPIVSAQATPTGTGGAVNLGRLGGTGPDIVAQADNGVADCGNGTIFNTGLIALGDASPQGQGSLQLVYIPVGASAYFAPGSGNEPGDSDEIEFGVAFGGGKDVLGLDAVHGGGGASTIRLGTDGNHDYINLNAAETTGIDQDVSMEGVDLVHFAAATKDVDNDDIRAIGGAGTGDLPFPVRMSVAAGGGDDLVVGGTLADFLLADEGSDTVLGKAGDDTIGGEPGADNLFGGDNDDLIEGDEGGDDLFGGNGGDILRGGPAADDLKGGVGADDLTGGPGFDTCVGGPGKDTFAGCEVVGQ